MGFMPPGPFGRGPFMPNYDPMPPQRKGPDYGGASNESNMPNPHDGPMQLKKRINNRMGPGAGEDRMNRFNNMQQSMGGFGQMPQPGFRAGGALPPALLQASQRGGFPPMNPMMQPQTIQPPSMGMGSGMPRRDFSASMGGFGQRMM